MTPDLIIDLALGIAGAVVLILLALRWARSVLEGN
jgi:hypothetical protein